MNATKTYRHVYARTCAFCSTSYETGTNASRYCSTRCRTDAGHARHRSSGDGEWLRTSVSCGVCGATFFRTLETGPNKKYCSPECAVRARCAGLGRFYEKNPGVMRHYNRTRRRRHGTDTLMNRVRRRYPDLPTVCEAKGCGETRVLELAHRPEFRRNGAWRTIDRYRRHMIWILCPTCHRVLDKGVETPKQLGLR